MAPGVSSRNCRILLPLALLLLVATPALAHADLLSASPSPNSRVDEAPERVVLNFSERLVQSGTRADIEDQNGTSYTRELEFPDDNPYRIILHLEPLPDGIYVVRYSTLSADDGHQNPGAYLLAVGVDFPDDAALPELGEDGSGVTSTETILRAAGYLGASLLLGGLAYLRFQPGLPERARLVVRNAAFFGVGIATVAAAVLVFQVVGRTGAGLLTTLETVDHARWTATRTLLLLVATLAVYPLRNAGDAPQGRTDLFAIAVGALSLLAASLGSHSASLPGAVVFAVGMHWIHFLTSAVWIGGVVAVLVALRHIDAADLARLVRRFSPAATVLVVAVLVTGIYVAGVHLGSLPEGLDTPYGMLVAAKFVLLALIVTVAGFHRYFLVPRVERGRTGLHHLLRRSVLVEVALMVAVLVVAGALSHAQPPHGGQDGHDHHDHGFPGEVHSFTTDLGHHIHVTVLPQPIRVGLQNITVHVMPVPGAEPANPNLFLQVTDPDGNEGPTRLMQRTGEWSWSLRDSHFTSEGTWQLRIVYQASGDRGDATVAIGL